MVAEDAGGDAAGVTIYVGIATIITAAAGLIGSIAALARVLRAPVRHSSKDDDEGEA